MMTLRLFVEVHSIPEGLRWSMFFRSRPLLEIVSRFDPDGEASCLVGAASTAAAMLVGMSDLRSGWMHGSSRRYMVLRTGTSMAKIPPSSQSGTVLLSYLLLSYRLRQLRFMSSK